MDPVVVPGTIHCIGGEGMPPMYGRGDFGDLLITMEVRKPILHCKSPYVKGRANILGRLPSQSRSIGAQVLADRSGAAQTDATGSGRPAQNAGRECGCPKTG